MTPVRLILALHNHQPVGNFDGVFADAYRTSYLPFLDVVEPYDDIKFVLHTSGPLLDWLLIHQPDYLARVRRLVEVGRVEILGGGRTEPILAMIPHHDRVGQIQAYSQLLESVFGQNIRGMWVAERVWEVGFVTALAEAGIDYTVLDDFHFQRAGLSESDLYGFYLTEDQGRVVKVFPGSERLRYLIPFQEPHQSYEYLKRIAEERPGATLVMADDGEKFGSWPHTFDHVYTDGWLRRFCDMLSANRNWIETTTFRRAVDETTPQSKVYLPDSSYREMTQWVLPATTQVAFDLAWKSSLGDPAADRLRPFSRAGGNWRNFKAKYPESDEMYARMMSVSNRLKRLGSHSGDPGFEAARLDLYRAQCNCTYWHGSFGGLYLPHLRTAVYRHLISADEILDEIEGKIGERVELVVGDFNFDARQEVRIENDHLIAFVRPAQGGHLYELDLRKPGVNVVATLERRPEPYHGVITARATGLEPTNGHSDGSDHMVMKQEHLDRMIVYDRHPRKMLVDHFYDVDVSLDDLIACHDMERGDFATGTYLSRVTRRTDLVSLVMERVGRVGDHVLQVKKTLTLEPGRPGLDVLYELTDLPEGQGILFAPEMNLAGMAGLADDRYYSTLEGVRLGHLSTVIDLSGVEGLNLSDGWLDLGVMLAWSTPAGLWCHPIQTVSQSEGGFEGVYQSSAVIPHWRIVADASRRWSVRIRLEFSAVSGDSRRIDLAEALPGLVS